MLALHGIRMWCYYYKALETKSISNCCLVELIIVHSLFSFRVALCVNAVVFYIFCSWAWMLMRLVFIQNHCVELLLGMIELLIF